MQVIVSFSEGSERLRWESSVKDADATHYGRSGRPQFEFLSTESIGKSCAECNESKPCPYFNCDVGSFRQAYWVPCLQRIAGIEGQLEEYLEEQKKKLKCRSITYVNVNKDRYLLEMPETTKVHRACF